MEKNVTDFESLIIEYIQNTYKISRIKHKNRFKRAMILDDGSIYLLKDNLETKQIKFKICYYIETIFACTPTQSKELVSKALGI